MPYSTIDQWTVAGNGILLHGAMLGCRMARSLSQAEKLVADGAITVNGAVATSNVWCNPGDVIRRIWPQAVRDEIARTD